MKAEIKAAVKDLRSDEDRGARQLALASLHALRDVADSCVDGELLESARALALARPMMAAVANAQSWAWSRYLESGDIHSAITDVIEAIEMAPDGMTAAAYRVVPGGTVMTHSYSSSVAELLTRLKPRRVIVSEARPFNEGVKVARRLLNSGISMTLITEAQMALFVQEADAVVVGAHTILQEGDFINKIGTRLLALAARDAGVPVFTISETFKVAAPSQPVPFAPEEGKPSEVCGEKWLEVRNVYYEVTPARLVNAFITENGVLDPTQVNGYAAEADRRWHQLMNSHEGV